MIDEHLLHAYRTAKYMVEYAGELHRLHVGETSEVVNTILRLKNLKSAYFITPENPFSCMLSAQENALRHQRFCDELKKHKYFYLSGYGTDEAESWAKESSYLIFTDDESSMQDLAARFGQNAFLKVTEELPTQLFVLDAQRYTQG
ncbi:DUF3293 domain-containing protein [Aliiglaciecola sp. LCG003]|uniref:DUF3293 domain-containing protein n=1 Tax=Aliiglaciecola sp. LCG003 TaxID=3053655 RepID=UPI00257285E1|nr:DUF3293 domain-containing protein [Aliiglaciecola sp. LCG003]WJG08089.1 DUF3293 domain-containing protein [Aliiglaciecola sp. LCG003]